MATNGGAASPRWSPVGLWSVGHPMARTARDGTFDLTVSVTAVETSSNDQATISKSFPITVNPVGETVTDGPGDDVYVADVGDDLFIFADAGAGRNPTRKYREPPGH